MKRTLVMAVVIGLVSSVTVGYADASLQGGVVDPVISGSGFQNGPGPKERLWIVAIVR